MLKPYLCCAVGVMSLVSATAVVGLAQAPAGPTFEVVSVKRNTSNVPGSNVNLRPDGGFSMTNLPVGALLTQAYPPAIPAEMVGLPPWVMTERYDVRTTSPVPNPTPDQWVAMVRAMLADRFGLVVHIDHRDQPHYDLVFARTDRRLGAGLKPADADCDRIEAERAATPVSPPQPGDLAIFGVPPPACTFRSVGARIRDGYGDHQGRLGDLLEGEGTLADLARTLRTSVARMVVNKTGLAGSYRVTMNFDMASSRRPPDAVPAADAPPSVFSAIQEQLGLKLQASGDQVDVLVIDRITHPTEN